MVESYIPGACLHTPIQQNSDEIGFLIVSK